MQPMFPPPEAAAEEGYVVAQAFGLFWAWVTKLVLFMTLASIAAFSLIGLALNTGGIHLNSVGEIFGMGFLMLLIVGVFTLNVIQTAQILKKRPTRNAYYASIVQSTLMVLVGGGIVVDWVIEIINHQVMVFPDWRYGEMVGAWLISLPMMILLFLGCLLLVVMGFSHASYANERTRVQRTQRLPIEL